MTGSCWKPSEDFSRPRRGRREEAGSLILSSIALCLSDVENVGREASLRNHPDLKKILGHGVQALGRTAIKLHLINTFIQKGLMHADEKVAEAVLRQAFSPPKDLATVVRYFDGVMRVLWYSFSTL